MNTQYKITGYRYGQSYTETCQNCGKIISHVAILQEAITGNILHVGLDCAITLTKSTLTIAKMKTLLHNREIQKETKLESYLFNYYRAELTIDSIAVTKDGKLYRKANDVFYMPCSKNFKFKAPLK